MMNNFDIINVAFKTILNNLEVSVIVVNNNNEILFSNNTVYMQGEKLQIGKDKIDTIYFNILEKTKQSKKKNIFYYIIDNEKKCVMCFPLKKNKEISGYVLCITSKEDFRGIELFYKRKKDEEIPYVNFHGLIVHSEEMLNIIQLIEKLANIDSTVLIIGETGTGKELIAKALHESSKRRKKPFIKVNCGAIPESLFEGEFFGVVKGAYTGAYTSRKGKIESARGGTLFLDEIGELPLNMQVKLLRFLQEKEFERVGESITHKVDVRIVAATNRNLKKLVAEGRFRRDLFYRLNVFVIKIPPLRNRKKDIFVLTDYFLKFYCEKFNRSSLKISKEVKNFFEEYYWPGNVRELKHLIEYSVIMSKNDIIQPEDLPEDLHGYFKLNYNKDKLNYNDEKTRILKILEEVKWNKTRAAELLGISRRTLYRKLSKYKIV